MKGLEDLMPTCPLMLMAWVDCLRWATGDEEIIARYESDTGAKVRQVTTGIAAIVEAEIDRATGYDLALLRAFVVWFNTNVWGDINEKAGGAA